MNIIIIAVIGLILKFCYEALKMKPIVADLNSPKYKAMKDYDSFEDWEKDWA